jgi:hypothetical protein
LPSAGYDEVRADHDAAIAVAEAPVMFGIESLGGNVQAAALIGIVLLEAAVLYVGYGALESALARRVTDLIRGF